jgi:hypothetical protein
MPQYFPMIVGLIETPPGSGEYVGSVPPPGHSGTALFAIFISCPGGGNQQTSFNFVYIDPSGTVVDQHNTPIAGATVTLLRADTADGPFVAVPNNSAIMSPTNRTNPDTTDAGGAFGWDVIAGFYKVQAAAPNCTSTTSDVLTIPPAVTGLVLQLSCNGTSLDSLGPAKVFIGLKNSDDVGTKFDVKVIVHQNGVVIGSGVKTGVNGGSSGFNNAKLQEIPLTLNGPTTVESGDSISFTVTVRIACGVAGHASGTARLWYNDAQANSRLTLVLNGSPTTYYLGSGNPPVMTTTVGPGPKLAADVFADSKTACPDRAYNGIGSWSATIG